MKEQLDQANKDNAAKDQQISDLQKQINDSIKVYHDNANLDSQKSLLQENETEEVFNAVSAIREKHPTMDYEEAYNYYQGQQGNVGQSFPVAGSAAAQTS